MQNNPLLFVIGLAVLGVIVILTTGIGGFARGGEFNRRHGNRLMRWRIIAQAVAIVLIMLFIWIRGY